MSVLVVGLSHQTAPVSLLERVAVPADELPKALDELYRAETISEVLLLSTCNRIEVYADVARFHPAVAEISGVLARRAGLPVSDLADHLYVHFGPLALFRKRIAYSQITHVEPGRSSVIDGWGIHYVPGRGWTWNLWGFDCVVLTLGDRTLRIGTDDVRGLTEFLQAKTLRG